MRVCLFEDQAVAGLEPIALTRPAFALLCGCTSLADKQLYHFAATSPAAANADAVRLDAAFLQGTENDTDTAAVVGPRELLHVDPSARVEPYVVADTTNGPVVIDRGAVVSAFSRLEGPCYVGPGSQVL